MSLDVTAGAWLDFREKAIEIRAYRLILVSTAQFCRSTNDVLMCSVSGSPLIHVPFSTKRIYPVLRVEAPRWTHPSFARAFVNTSRRKAWKVKRENRLDCAPRQSVNVLSAI
jgi:hypothetical protein